MHLAQNMLSNVLQHLNSDSKIILIIYGSTDQNIKKHLIKIWRSLKLINIIIYKVELNCGYNIINFKMYYYNPFVIQNNIRGLVYDYSPEDLINLADNIILQLSKRLINLFGYPINICINIHEGTVAPDVVQNGTIVKYKLRDGEIANVVASYLNASPNYITPKDNQVYGVRLKNGTLTGCLNDSENNHVDLVANAWPILKNSYIYTEPLFVIDDVKLACLAPKQVRFVKSFYMHTFSPLIFALIVMSHILTILALCLANRFHTGKFLWTFFVDYYYITFASMLMISQDHKKYLLFKTISIIWIFLSMINCITYQSKMVQSLTVSTETKDINTVKELAESGYTLLINTGFEKIVDHLMDAEDYPNIHDILKSRLQHITDYDVALAKVYKERSAVIFCSVFQCQLLRLTIFSNETGEDLLHVFSADFSKRPHAQMTNIRSPYRKRFLDVIMKIYEGGIIMKWEKTELNRLLVSSKKKRHAFFKDTPKDMFNMPHLYPIFKALCYTWILAFIVFLLELLWFHRFYIFQNEMIA